MCSPPWQSFHHSSFLDCIERKNKSTNQLDACAWICGWKNSVEGDWNTHQPRACTNALGFHAKYEETSQLSVLHGVSLHFLYLYYVIRVSFLDSNPLPLTG